MRLTAKAKVLGAAIGLALAAQASAQVTFYEREGFRGRVFSIAGAIDNLNRTGFNDAASSVVVDRGRWEVCDRARFQGRCVVLQPGSYDSLRSMGLDNEISSVRPLGRNARYDYEAPAPLAAPNYDWRARPNERLYEADVTSVRAVVGPPEQRCWMERQDVVEDRGGPNVPGAIIGGVLGGILGHQIGGGRGQDVATVAGAVGGAAVGSNVGRGGQQVYSQDVQRCAQVSRGVRPSYWDVTYNFRGIEHRVQLAAPPGPTIAVNGNGEPRG